MKKVHRIRLLPENGLIVLPKEWGMDKDGFLKTVVLMWPPIRPAPWHFTVQFGYRPERESLFLHCHWTNENEKKRRREEGKKYERESVLEIYLSTKNMTKSLPQRDWKDIVDKLSVELQQGILSSVRQGILAFESLTHRDNFFWFRAGPLPDENEMFQGLLEFFPYETQRKQVIISPKPTPSMRRKLNSNLFSPTDRWMREPGLYMGFLIQPHTSRVLHSGTLFLHQAGERPEGCFFLNLQIPILAGILFKPIRQPLWEVVRSLLKPDRITVKWKGEEIPSAEVERCIHGEFAGFERVQVEQIVSCGLESYFWQKGYDYDSNREFEWGIPFGVAYRGSTRAVVVLAWTKSEIQQRVNDVLLFRSKYKARYSMLIVPDGEMASRCVRNHNLRNVTIMPLDTEFFVKMFYDSAGIQVAESVSDETLK